MLEAALLRQNRIPGNMLRRALHRLAVFVHHANARWRNHGNIAICEKKNLASVMEQRGNIARDEVFVIAEADN